MPIHAVGRCAIRAMLVVLSCAILFAVPPVSAVSIEVSSGFVSQDGPDVPQYFLLGLNFLNSGPGGDFANVGPTLCSPCKAGDTVSLLSHMSGSSLAGHTTLNGVDYDVAAIDRKGDFDFTADPFIVPDVDLDILTFSEPFTFLGTLVLPNNVSLSLGGQGIATLQLTGFETNVGRLFNFDSVSYDFTATTPEPGTLLFLGSGSLAIAFLRGRRRRSPAS